MSNVLGFKLVFKGIAESIHRTIQALQQEAANGAISIATEVRFESELFCVESILQGADHTDQEAFTLVQQLLELVLAINYTKQKLLGTALEIMVGCSKFFGQRVDLLQSAFKFLGNTIQFKTFEDNSAEAIANLCRDNKSFVLENISDFFECTLRSPVFNKVCYKKDIVVGLTSVVNSLSNRETKTELIMKICQPFAKEILQTTVSEGRTDLTKNFIKNIDYLTLVVQNLSPAEPEEKDHTMLHILTDMWKLLEEILLKHYVGATHAGRQPPYRVPLQVHQAHHALPRRALRQVHRALLQDRHRQLRRTLASRRKNQSRPTSTQSKAQS
jgi:hypothetical protein